MKIIGKAIGAAVLASVTVGVVLALGFILLGQVQGEAGGEVGRGATVLQFAFAALLLSWGTSIPLGIVGGILAGIVLQRQRLPASVWVWVIRGIGVGSIMGALGAPATPVLFWGASASPGLGSMAVMYSMVGAVGGTLTGGLVAVWCYRAQQSAFRMACPGDAAAS